MDQSRPKVGHPKKEDKWGRRIGVGQNDEAITD